MPRSSTPKHSAAPPSRGGVIRAAKVIPLLAPAPVAPAQEPVNTGVCSGRCGHCNLHPCRLHESV